MSQHIKTLLSLIKRSLLDPENTSKKFNAVNLIQQGYDYSQKFQLNNPSDAQLSNKINNPLEDFFVNDEHRTIWKWLHYFDIYHQHLAAFQNKNPTLLEIGVYGGGSLEMWQTYFNQGSRIIGVDIDERCRDYAGDNISILIGDQSDRQFWRDFSQQTPKIDIVIDDGGHRPAQQIATLEECLPLISPGGVYICEDVHGIDNYFLDYIHGLSKSMNAYKQESDYNVIANSMQQHIHSIHLYPFMIVIQVNSLTVSRFTAEKKGTGNEKE